MGRVLPAAISEHIKEDPEDIAEAIAPAMGKAIQEQVRLEADSMVEALYPVIGTTVSKYMVEVVKSINDRVENALSFQGFSRKLRARMQGVSEAELILQESLPFRIRAIFLIHKGSGLIVADVQPSGSERLESDMVGGMLTAIRSFANDCMNQAGKSAELNEIEYDDFSIVLEVAGYCYLAIVLQGRPPKDFANKTRATFSDDRARTIASRFRSSTATRRPSLPKCMLPSSV